MLKRIVLCCAFSVAMFAASADVDVYSPQELQAISQQLRTNLKGGFANKDLAKYGNHYTMVAFRNETGSAEVHKTEADLFVVTEGHATLVTGGRVIGGHTTKPNEIRGTSIDGGTKHEVETGSIVHIPAGVPHQLIIPKGTQFTYFVLKVQGQ